MLMNRLGQVKAGELHGLELELKVAVRVRYRADGPRTTPAPGPFPRPAPLNGMGRVSFSAFPASVPAQAPAPPIPQRGPR